MQLWDKLAEYAKNFSSYRTTMDFGDVAEILIIAVLLYYTLVWMKTTRAWILLKGLIVILAFLLLAYFFRMTTILWMAQNVLGFAVTALIVVLQPELRKALEELGKKNIISSVLPFDNSHRVNERILGEDDQRDHQSLCGDGQGKDGSPDRDRTEGIPA